MAASRLASTVVGGENRFVRAVGGDEVDDGRRVLQVLHELEPARVGLHLRVAGAFVEVGAGGIEGRNAGFAAARNVQCREVERQADEVVAQCFGDEFVDFAAALARHALGDDAGRFFGGHDRWPRIRAD